MRLALAHWPSRRALTHSTPFHRSILSATTRPSLQLFVLTAPQFFCDDTLNVPGHRLSSLPSYVVPDDGPLNSYREVSLRVALEVSQRCSLDVHVLRGADLLTYLGMRSSQVCAGLPHIDRPEAFGQHSNADIASQARHHAHAISCVALMPSVGDRGDELLSVTASRCADLGG